MNVMSLISVKTAVLIKPRNVSSHQTRWRSSSEIKTERVSVSLLFAGDQTLRVRLQQTIYSVDSSTATWEAESAGKPMPTSANIWELVLRRSAALASLLARCCLCFTLAIRAIFSSSWSILQISLARITITSSLIYMKDSRLMI